MVMQGKQSWLWIGGVIVLLVLVGILAWYLGARSVSDGNVPKDDEVAPAPSTNTREEVPEDVTVPGLGDTVPENIAAPERIADVAPHVDDKLRAFTIKVENDKFVPDTVIVQQGDAVEISITAVDKDYEFVQPDYGLRTALPRGEKKFIGGQFKDVGKFKFYCGTCGGPDEGPVGYLVVVPKEKS